MEVTLLRTLKDGKVVLSAIAIGTEPPSLYGVECLQDGSIDPLIPDGRYKLEIAHHEVLRYKTVMIRGVPGLPHACCQAKDVGGKVTEAITLSMVLAYIYNSRVALNHLYNRVQRENKRDRECWLTVATALRSS